MGRFSMTAMPAPFLVSFAIDLMPLVDILNGKKSAVS